MLTMLCSFGLIAYLLAGLIIGSFLNVVIYRLPRMLYQQSTPPLSLFWPRSHCPCCQHKLAIMDNIPLVSWLYLRGLCRYCRQAIDWRYPLTEALCGVWFSLVGYITIQYGAIQYSAFVTADIMTIQTLVQQLPVLLLFCLLYCVCLIDLQYYLIPDVLNYLLLWCGLICSVSGLTAIEPLPAVLSVVLVWCLLSVCGWCFRLLRGYQGIGAGDIKLFAASAGWLGWQYLPLLLLFAAGNGLLLWLLQRFCHYYRRRKAMAGNTVYNGAVDALTARLREGINPAVHLPFGPAIALAVLVLFILTSMTTLDLSF